MVGHSTLTPLPQDLNSPCLLVVSLPAKPWIEKLDGFPPVRKPDLILLQYIGVVGVEDFLANSFSRKFDPLNVPQEREKKGPNRRLILWERMLTADLIAIESLLKIKDGTNFLWMSCKQCVLTLGLPNEVNLIPCGSPFF